MITIIIIITDYFSDFWLQFILISMKLQKTKTKTTAERPKMSSDSFCSSILNQEPTPSLKTLSFLLFVQVNEAFAPQFIAVQKELELDVDKTNVNGGAIALGHPVGTSGARITGHLVHELRRRGAKYAVGSACIGGGQGIAIVLENVQ